MSETIEQPWPGFWPRIGALLIDWLVLGAPAVVIGWLAFDLLAPLGSAGRLIGLAAALAYFGLLESRAGGGQSLGKRVLKLQVTRADGALLSPGHATLRALVKVAPFIANGVNLPDDGTVLPLVVVLVAGVALFGVGLAQVYLYVFNRPARQLLHDFVARSVVVRFGQRPAAALTPATHRNVSLGLVGLVVFLLVGVSAWAEMNPPKFLQRLAPMRAAVQALPGVLNVGVAENTTASWTLREGAGRSQTVIVSARLNRWPADSEVEALRVARAALAASNLRGDQQLGISLQYGYELGLASGSRSFLAVRTVDEWRNARGLSARPQR